MHRIDTSTAQVDKFGAGKNGFTGGNPQTGELPTALDADFFDSIQEEISGVIESAGIALAKSDNGQLLSALKKIITKDGTALPFGVPIPWPTKTPPDGWITMSGQTITASQYPKLFALYGANLPDLRGEFIRGWDNGRGVDSGRILLAFQSFAMQEVTGNLGGYDMNNDGLPNPDGPFRAGARTANSFPSGGTISMAEVYTSFALSRVAQTALETRPRNIAFNYIVRGI